MHTQLSPVGGTPVSITPESTDRAITPTQSLARTIHHCFISSTQERMVTQFLGEKVDALVFNEGGRIVVFAMSEALSRFAAATGGEIVYTTALDRHQCEESPPAYQSVAVDGHDYRILTKGWVFLTFPGQRVVVHIYREPAETGPRPLQIGIYSVTNASVFLSKWIAYTRHHSYFRGHSFFADGSLIEQSQSYTWDDVILTEHVRQQLHTHITVFLRKISMLREAGLKTRRGVILTGPPGTGKTLVGKVLASTLGTTLLWALPRHLNSMESIAEVVAAARFLSPTVLFLEDLDLIGEDRDSNRSSLLGELMNQLDGAAHNDGLLTVATTNRLEVIEGALRNRPGRFDRVIEIGLPDVGLREELLREGLAATTLTQSEIKSLAQFSDGISPAQLEESVNVAFLKCAAEDGDSSSRFKGLTLELLKRAILEICGDKSGGMGFHSSRVLKS